MTSQSQPETLIVDDEPRNLALLSQVLKQSGFRVRAATSGARALEAAHAASPDCVLLDVGMPEMDGYEVCARFQDDDQLRSIPIIFLTAHDDAEHKVKAFASGGRDYVSKPFQAEEVVARVRNQLRIKQLEESLRQQNQLILEANLKLQEAAQVKSRVTATLVHDLRSPLMVIASVLDSPITQGSLLDARDAFARVKRMVSELLELSKSEQVDVKRRVEVVSLPDIWQGVYRLAQHVARANDVELQLVVQPQNWFRVSADIAQLERAFTNLVDNALKFTPPGGKVTIGLHSEDGTGVERGLSFVRASVCDSGPGIPPEELPFVFDAYRQVPGTEGTGGVGLGLAIAARIVAQHGGRIHVHSQLGVGTEMRVLLPLHRESAAGA